MDSPLVELCARCVGASALCEPGDVIRGISDSPLVRLCARSAWARALCVSVMI